MATWKRLQGYGDDVTGSFTGTLNSTEFPMAAMVTGANAAAVKSTLSLQNVANESRATILGGNLTGTIDGTAVATVKSGASAGASANQDSTSTILGGNLTGTIDGTAVGTVKSGAASGATANQDSTAAILGGDLTGEVNGVAVATISGGASRANAGLASNGDVNRAVPESKGGTGLTSNDTLLNSAISIAADGSLSGAGGGQVTMSGIGVTDADYKNSNTTAANVGLGSVTNASQATIVAAALSEADADDVGLGNVSNITTAAMRAGVTASDVGLGNVSNESSSTIQAAAVATVLGENTPASLNTLKEIATSLGDNTSLSTTLVNSIATKQQAAATGIDSSGTPTQDVGTIGYDGSGNPWIVVA